MTLHMLFNQNSTLFASTFQVRIFSDFSLGIGKYEKAFIVDPEETFSGEVDGHAIKDRIID